MVKIAKNVVHLQHGPSTEFESLNANYPCWHTKRTDHRAHYGVFTAKDMLGYGLIIYCRNKLVIICPLSVLHVRALWTARLLGTLGDTKQDEYLLV